jgi:CRP-like cAMP-binding protein
MLLKHFLRSLPDFGHFSEGDLDALAAAMRVDAYPDGHVFIQQGQPGREIFMVVDGQVRVSREDALTGRGQDLKTLREGELFGLLALIDHLPAAATCTAVGPVKAASLPRSAYNLLTSAAAPIAFHFQYLVARQLARDLSERSRVLRELLASQA